MDKKQQLDEWELKLEDKLKNLQDCQKNMGLESCTSCEKMFDCEVRKIYVHGVYQSMNKGHGGGFEF